MKKINLTCVIVIILLQENVLFSQDPNLSKPGDGFKDSTEVERVKKSIEPILIEETLPNEVGEWDLRFSFDYSKNDKESNITFPDIQLFFGIFRNLGGEISMPLIYRKGETVEYGVGSISTSVKWLILNQGHAIPAVVLGFEVGFPTNGFGEESEERAFEYSPYIAFLKDFGQLCVQGNIALSTDVPVCDGEINHRSILNIAFLFPIFDGKVDVLAELKSSWSFKGQNELLVSPGIKYNLNDKHFFALAVPVGLNNQSSTFGIIFQYQLQL